VRTVVLVALVGLVASPATEAHAASVFVPGRTCDPNAFEPARACTLQLNAPGDRLAARGLTMFAEPAARPDARGEFGYLPFGPDDFLFDQVNVFWHAQHFLERLERYGLDVMAHPIFVRVQPGAGSFTHFVEPVSTIGTGLNGLDQGAKDGDIIVHEITHAVFNPRMPLGTYPIDKGESIPVLEGLADYFAAAVHGNTRIAEFARPPAGYHDITSDPAVFHYDRFDILPADPYSRGKVLNGALLEIRAALGETADELVFAATDYAPLRCFTCVADAIRSADNDRYAGAHMATIDSAFARRGIPSGPPIGIRIDTPVWAWLGDDITARLQHVCGVGPFQITWRARDASGNVEVLPSNTDQVSLRAQQTVTLEATLRDGRGVEYPASPVTVSAYDRTDPSLHVNGVRIDGPASISPGFRTRYTFVLLGGTGVPPVNAQWTAENAQLSEMTGNGVTVSPTANPVRLKLVYRDAAGQMARDSVTVTVLQPIIVSAIQGLSIMPEGGTGDYSVTAQGGLPPYHYAWTQQDVTGTHALRDSSLVVSLPTTADFTLRVTVSEALGRTGSATLLVRKLVPLALDPIAGPSELVAGQSGQFSVRPQGGHTPIHYQWNQVGVSASYRLADSPTVTSVSETNDFSLQLLATDAAGSTASRTHVVRVTGSLQVGPIEGPVSVVSGERATFRVAPRGGTPPYRYNWMQQDPVTAIPLGDSSEVTARPAIRDYWMTVTVRDSRDIVRVASRLLPVTPAPPPPPPVPPAVRAFRVLGNVLSRGANALLELPTPDAPGELVVLDATGRVRASGRVPEGSPPTLSVVLPPDLDSGVYFVRLQRSDRTWTARFVVIAR